jgi:hypothetical protein
LFVIRTTEQRIAKLLEPEWNTNGNPLSDSTTNKEALKDWNNLSFPITEKNS